MSLKQEIKSVLKNNCGKILVGFIFVGLTVLLEAIQPLVTKTIIDDGIQGKDFSVITSMGYILFSVIILKMVLDYFGNTTVLKVTVNFLEHLNKVIIQSIFNKKRNFYSENSNGEVLEKTMEVWNLEDSISANTIYSCISIVNLFVTIGILINYSLSITVFILIVSFFLLFVMKRQSKKIKQYSEKYYHYSGKIYSNLSESIYGMEEIANLNEKKYFKNRFLNSVNEKLSSFIDFSRTRFFTTSSISGITALMYLCILIYIGYNIVSKDNMTIGTYTLILSYSSRIVTPIVEIGNIISEIQPIRVMYARMREIVDKENTILDEYLMKIKTDDITSLRIENLSFSYDGDKEILRNITMEFYTGGIYLIRGANGSGKSTLFKLLLKNYNNYTGNIKINDANINSIDSSNFMYQTLQHPFIFNMSIKENILMSQIYDEEKYSRIIELLNLDKIFSKATLYNNLAIEENGKSLSGGQIKLIEIARIFYRDSKIILLDEITANLDKKMCEFIVDSVKKMSSNKIIIVIDHSELFDLEATEIFELGDN